MFVYPQNSFCSCQLFPEYCPLCVDLVKDYHDVEFIAIYKNKVFVVVLQFAYFFLTGHFAWSGINNSEAGRLVYATLRQVTSHTNL